jgi:hypothetical protein
VHAHNDLIITAKQKRLEAWGFIGARVTCGLELLLIRWKDGPEACGGLRRHHAEGLDSAPQARDRNVQGWDCRSLRHGNPEMLRPW